MLRLTSGVPGWTVTRAWAALAIARKVCGLSGLLKIAMKRLYWNGHRFVRFRVELRDWVIADRPSGRITAREATLDELRRFRTSRPGLPLQFYADVTHAARRVYVGLVDGTIAHVAWVYTQDDHIRHMRLAPGEIIIDGLYTLPEFRGLGLLAATEHALLADAKLEGKRVAYALVAIDNHASLRGFRKAGFSPVGTVMWRRICGWSIAQYLSSIDDRDEQPDHVSPARP